MKTIHVFLASAAATAVLLSGVYAVAATAATSIAASITTEETVRHARSVEFSARVSRVSDEQQAPVSERRSTAKRQATP